MTGGDATTLKEHWTALQRAQLIQERRRAPELGMEYAFKSKVIRDVAYESLLAAQRSTYHRQVAEYLEGLLGAEDLAQYYGVLAYHYRHAGQPSKELSCVLETAKQAKEIYANAESLKHYTRALELLDELEAQAPDKDQRYAIRTQRFKVLNERREVSYLMGDFQSGQADARAMLKQARQLDDPVWLIDALLQQPGVAKWQSGQELGEGVSIAQETLALARQLGDRHREMQSLFTIANQRLFLNDPTWHEMGERALKLARQLDDRRSEARILIWLGSRYSWTDQPERGMAYLEDALPICQALDDKISEVDLLSQFGLQAERTGDYYRLLTEYQQKQLAISRDIGYRQGEGKALFWCGQTQSIYLGDYKGGVALLEEARRVLEGTPDVMFALLRLVQIQAVQSKYNEALEALEHMRHIDEQAVFPHARAGLRLVSTILYNALGDETHLRRALDLATQARRLAAENPLVSQQYEIAIAYELAAAHLGLAECVADEAERQAHLRQALRWSQEALDVYESFGFVQIIECVSEEILYRHSLALAANGRQAEADEYLQRAYGEMMRKHALIPPASPFRRTYLENVPVHRDIEAAGASGERGSLVSSCLFF